MDRLRRLTFLFLALALATPAFAQVSLVGEWSPRYHEDQPERIPGPELGDYTGLPINEGARLAADSWDASRLTLREHQCKVHNGPYILHGPIQFRIWEEKDLRTQQVIALQLYLNTYEQERTIWMDGRPHPPDYAMHTAMGFSTGKWDGDILVVTTTHLKEGWTRRNGLTRSDSATVTEHLIRHGDTLTLVISVVDPKYYTEPVVRSRDYEYEVNGDIGPYPCEPVEEIVRPKGEIPHHLPGQNPFLTEYAKAHGIPQEAARGGAETMYPEYRKKLREMMKNDAAKSGGK
jgi:hypothetical protein